MKNEDLLRQKLFQFDFDRLYHFDNFFAAEGNKTAWMAAKKLCEDEKGFNKNLFFFGEPGYGKTHLLQAIGNDLALRNPGSVIKLLPFRKIRERFVDASEGEQGFVDLIHRYESSDAILMDDVEEISFSALAQEALFHLYNHFRDKQKIIVATGRNSPSVITTLSVHLTTRMGWGMAVRIGLPDERTRRKVLEKLVKERKLLLAEKEIDYILNHFPRDFHNLQRTVEFVNSYSLLTRRKVTIPLIKEACSLR